MAQPILADAEASGIYQIRNLVNGKRYIGSAKCFRTRWNAHRAKLARGSHHSKHLQASWTKHGPESFVFEVIELCEFDSLIRREQFWLDELSPEFNVCTHAGSSLGRRFSQESKDKIREKAVGRKPWPRTAEHRRAMSAARKGKQHPAHVIAALQAGRAKRVWSDEQRMAAAETTKKRFESGQLSRIRSPEYRNKISESLRGRRLPEETKKKIGDALRGRKIANRAPISPEALERVRAANRIAAEKRRGKKMSQASVDKMAQSLRGRKLSAAHCEKLSERSKATWSNPEFRAKMSAIHKVRWARTRGSKDA